jgi:hypothetical protein
VQNNNPWQTDTKRAEEQALKEQGAAIAEETKQLEYVTSNHSYRVLALTDLEQG